MDFIACNLEQLHRSYKFTSQRTIIQMGFRSFPLMSDCLVVIHYKLDLEIENTPDLLMCFYYVSNADMCFRLYRSNKTFSLITHSFLFLQLLCQLKYQLVFFPIPCYGTNSRIINNDFDFLSNIIDLIWQLYWNSNNNRSF